MKKVKYVELDDSYAKLEELRRMHSDSGGCLRVDLEDYINRLEFGQLGENEVKEELLGLGIPATLISGLNLSYETSNAQIDFVLVTSKIVYFIECKSMVGDIGVSENGEFKRYMSNGDKYVGEDFPSPVNQNRKHITVLDRILEDGGIAKSKALEGLVVKSLVVFTNKRTNLLIKDSPNHVKNVLVKTYHLKNRIEKEVGRGRTGLGKINNIVEGLKRLHNCQTKDYVKEYIDRYEYEKRIKMLKKQRKTFSDLKIALERYREEKSKTDGIQPYFILSEEQINNLLDVRPTSVSELKAVKGFNKNKISKFGKDIILVVSENI
jgi:hypothetical protein